MTVTATELTKQRIDAGGLPHLYIGQEGEIRDLWIERMFSTVFFNEPLDEDFRANFRTYMFTFFASDDADVPDTLFEDARYCCEYIGTLFGLVRLTEYKGDTDPDFAACTHTVLLRCKYSSTREILVHAPSDVRACLLAIICIFRWCADQNFAHTLQAGGVTDADTTEDNSGGL